MGKEPFISVIIPCYNADRFIQETIRSVLSQTYQNFEVLVLNDGSTDRSEAEVLTLDDNRIRYHSKHNTGVSDTRNKGLDLSEGEYILFLDADDVLTPDFLQSRLAFLLQNPSIDFCCGKVIKIDEKGHPAQQGFRGTYTNVLEEILLYDPSIITCPSNYLIRTEALRSANVLFNTQLSSTADRFFFIQLSLVSKGGFVSEGGELLYRVSQTSMSHNLSKSLIDDNELFFQLVSQLKDVPDSVFSKFKPMITYILGSAYIQLKEYNKGLKYIVQCFVAQPNYLVKRLSHKFISR